MASLKHALLYFGKVRIPKNVFLYCNDETKFLRHINTVPFHAIDHIEALKDQGLVEFEDDRGSVERLSNLIAGQAHSLRRPYHPGEVLPLFNFLDIPPNTGPFPEELNYGALLLAACTLASAGREHALPCVDNPVLFDIVNLGLKALFEDFISTGFSPREIDDLKAQYLGQHLINLYLPSFAFRSFDDVLDVRERMRDQLAALHGRVEGLASQLSAAPWDARFGAEVGSLVKREVEPAIAELQKAARLSLTRVVATAGVALTLQSLLPAALASALIGISVWDVVQRERDRIRSAKLTHAFSLLLRVDR